ncbi:unnamed protein product, partial [Closterium sp. NIES-53]
PAATTATLTTAPTAAMASPTVLTFDAEGRAVDFDVWWTTRDAVARLAVRSHLPPAERAHFGQYKNAQSLYDAVVACYSSRATAALSRPGQGHERYFLLVVDNYSRYTTVFPLRSKGEQNGIAERRIGMVMAAPHFLWSFAVQYAAHQINLQPRVSLPETTPTLQWTGKVGDASAFRVWGSRAFVRDTTADKLSSRAVPCVFLGFPPVGLRSPPFGSFCVPCRALLSNRRHHSASPPSDESVEPSGPYPELVGCLITSGMGLVLGGRARVVLTGHADASCVDDLATQRSSQGYTFSLGSGCVSWRSTRSSSVLSSSCEAEIYAGAMAAQELRWLTYLLTDLGEVPRSPPVLYVDNKAMLALGQEHRLEHRTKHIALRYFIVRELQQRGQLRLAYVASQANIADVFTKALQPCDHQRF